MNGTFVGLTLKGMSMTRKYWVVAGIVIGLLAAMVLAQASTSGSAAGRGGPRWDYGIFRGEGTWTWYAPEAAVDNADAGDFAAKMHAAYSQKGTELEMNIINSLAAQGWELVAAPEGNKYVLRRLR
jgi:hypothetical protein